MNETMLKQMMKMVSQMLPDEQEPSNQVAVFVSDKVSEMMPDPEIARLFKTALVDYCNRDPDKALEVLVTLANDVASLCGSLSEDVGDEAED